MKPGFEFDQTEQAWHHGLEFWHRGVMPWFQLPGWSVGLGLAVVGALYFAPALTAFVRKHPNRLAILFLNGLLGWTFFGWAIALVWAVTVGKKTDN
jgi:hypothetical protein